MNFTHHELIELQEHIHGEAASSVTCRQLAPLCVDPDLKAFVQQEAQTRANNMQKLMNLLTEGPRH